MHMDLFHCREEQCPFEREFIRNVVKEMEVSVTFIVCYFILLLFTYLAYNKSDPVWKKSVFFRHIPAIEKCLKADANWPLQHCYDMVNMFR